MTCLFEMDFDAEPARVPATAPDPSEARAREAALREAAHREGYAAGLAAGRDAEAQALHDALGALSRGIGALAAEADAHRAALEAQAVSFARAACERIAPELRAAMASERAAAEVRRALALALGDGWIEVALSPATLARHGPALERALAEAAPEGQGRLRGDPGLAEGDARVRWAGGGMTYAFDDALGGVLAALRARAPDEETQDG